ncbi:hypothetical protein V1477_006199 [Vespula maculifrons]|uniref:Uncharacterized protein n=1 Tax=Vespula maculifrons TaxID=7453 RepID=A0ABD2CJR8_VESMC
MSSKTIMLLLEEFEGIYGLRLIEEPSGNPFERETQIPMKRLNERKKKKRKEKEKRTIVRSFWYQILIFLLEEEVKENEKEEEENEEENEEKEESDEEENDGKTMKKTKVKTKKKKKKK